MVLSTKGDLCIYFFPRCPCQQCPNHIPSKFLIIYPSICLQVMNWCITTYPAIISSKQSKSPDALLKVLPNGIAPFTALLEKCPGKDSSALIVSLQVVAEPSICASICTSPPSVSPSQGALPEHRVQGKWGRGRGDHGRQEPSAHSPSPLLPCAFLV